MPKRKPKRSKHFKNTAPSTKVLKEDKSPRSPKYTKNPIIPLKDKYTPEEAYDLALEQEKLNAIAEKAHMSLHDLIELEDLYLFKCHNPTFIAQNWLDAQNIPKYNLSTICNVVTRCGWATKRKQIVKALQNGEKPQEILHSYLRKKQDIDPTNLTTYAQVKTGDRFLNAIADGMEELTEAVLQTTKQVASEGQLGKAHEGVKTLEKTTKIFMAATGLDQRKQQGGQGFSLNLPADMSAVVEVKVTPQQKADGQSQDIKPAIPVIDDPDQIIDAGE